MTRFSLKALLFSGLAMSMAAAPALADVATEAYVEENANIVLNTLNDPALDSAARTAAFEEYMDQFTDLGAVSRFVIGRYAREFTEAESAAYQDAFRTYALAVYEAQLDSYRGERVEVLGSVDRSARDSIVNTRIPRADGQAMDVRWRVLNRNGEYQVVDVALNIEGNLLWLAIEQRAQFIALLDRTRGSSDALIAKIEEMTAELYANKRIETAFDQIADTEEARTVSGDE
ncbi:MAG: ABC transporter substrate-binding protein [Pseudomonadota bacterium]